MTTSPLIWLATGGTGGHVFPAEALADVLIARGYHISFLVDGRTADVKIRHPEFTTHVLPAASPTRSGILKKIEGVWKLLLGTIRAYSLIRAEKPTALVSFGGYASIPPTIAAVLTGTPIILHEQNAVLGRAHRFILCKAARVALSFPRTTYADMKACNRMIHTGNPVRGAIRTVRELPYPAAQNNGPINILVTGGSLGARIFSDQVPEALALLPDELRKRLEVIQQSREEDIPRAQDAYRRAGINAVIAPFFTDMPQRLALAQLVIARSGASTCAELITVGRPSVLVPLPIAADDHQTVNAQYLVDAGAAWLLPQGHLTPDHLSRKLTEILSSPDLLVQAAANARALGKPDAAELLADVVAEFAWPTV